MRSRLMRIKPAPSTLPILGHPLEFQPQPKESSMYQRILVPVDGSPTSDRGLDEAIRIATPGQGRLRLVHVIDELSFSLAMDASWGNSGNWLEMLREGGAALLEAATTRVRTAGLHVEAVLYDSFAGTVDQKVVEEAVAWKADVIVLGTHGRRGLGRLVLGSSAERILRMAPVPVLLVRAPAEPEQAPAAKTAPAPVHISQPSAALSVERI